MQPVGKDVKKMCHVIILFILLLDFLNDADFLYVLPLCSCYVTLQVRSGLCRRMNVALVPPSLGLDVCRVSGAARS